MSCTWCKDEGVIFAEHKFKEASPYAFLCPCPARTKLKTKLAVWKEECHDKYIPEFAKDEPRHLKFKENKLKATLEEIRSIGLQKDWNHPKLVEWVAKHGKQSLLDLLNKGVEHAMLSTL